MAEIFSISIADATKEISESFGAMLSTDAMTRLTKEISFDIAELVADHLGRASVSRHKSADALGASHTGFLEFAPARVGQSSSKTGGRISASNTPTEALVTIENTPGISRAFHPLDITPKKAKWLTIPINRISYGKRCAELEGEGWSFFSTKSKKSGKGKLLFGKKGKDTIPLYWLSKGVHIPQDRGLLPTERKIEAKAKKTAEMFIMTEAL